MSINPILICVYPLNRGGQIYPTLTVIFPTPTLHLARFMASSFSKLTLLLSFSTCIFHNFFGCPCFLLPFTSNSQSFSQNMPIIPPQMISYVQTRHKGCLIYSFKLYSIVVYSLSVKMILRTVAFPINSQFLDIGEVVPYLEKC